MSRLVIYSIAVAMRIFLWAARTAAGDDAFWSASVGLRYRALARDRQEGLVWFWIGPHGDYDQLLTK